VVLGILLRTTLHKSGNLKGGIKGMFKTFGTCEQGIFLGGLMVGYFWLGHLFKGK